MNEGLNELKKKIFYDLLNLAGRVFIVVRWGSDVVIGKRGFLPAEKEKGLVLVFNSRMNFQWTEGGISARLVFGATAEDCHIPSGSVVSVFSPELSAQFSVAAEEPEPSGKEEEPDEKKPADADQKVVKVDFGRKKAE